MVTEQIVIRSMSEVVAIVPHVLGVHPQDSMVVFPEVIAEAPVARVNLPRGPSQCAAVADGLAKVYAGQRVGVVLLAYTDRLDLADQACEVVRSRLEPSTPVIGSVAVQGETWLRLDGPQRGEVEQRDWDLMTAEFLLLNRAAPFRSLADLRRAYLPAQAVPAEIFASAADRAREAARGGQAGEVEREWVTLTMERTAAGRGALSDPDAARLISDLQHIPLRDHAWAAMERGTSGAHAEMFRDLLTRCPAGAEAPVASLTAFAHWLDGDGVKARVALERVPAGQNYPMARLLATALEVGMHPNTWDPPRRVTSERSPGSTAQLPRSSPEAREPPKPTRHRDNPGPGR